MSSVVVCVPTTGWDCNLCISISPTIVGKSEYAGEAHICRLHYQVLLFASITQKYGRTEQKSCALFQTQSPVNATPVLSQFLNAVSVYPVLISSFVFGVISAAFNLLSYDQTLMFCTVSRTLVRGGVMMESATHLLASDYQFFASFSGTFLCCMSENVT
jgi:hypothetical protein